MTGQVPPGQAGPAPVTGVEIKFGHTTIRSIKVSANDIRSIFGLGGTGADDLLDRLVVLLERRPSLLDCAGVEDIASWEADTGHHLIEIAGMAPAEAAEYVTLTEHPGRP